MYAEVAVLAVFVFLYSTVASRIERTAISGPMVFVLVGLAVGPLGLGWLGGDVDERELRVLADITLALVLFIDAANADLGVLKRSLVIPRRMLLLGLPLTIALGFGVGLLVFDQLSVFEALTYKCADLERRSRALFVKGRSYSSQHVVSPGGVPAESVPAQALHPSP